MTATVVLAAGGTGGHMFPALALAGELARRNFRPVVICDRRGARYLGAGAERRVIIAASPSGTWLRRLAGVFKLGVGTLQSLVLLMRLRPRALVTFGGYASIPVALAALLLRRPVVVHEQNAVLGRANRMVVRHAAVLALSYEATRNLPEPALRCRVLTGNPVRSAVAALGTPPYRTPGPDAPLRIIVVGGSQGARVFSDVVPGAVARLPDPLRSRLELTQQCRPEDLERVRAAYAAIGFEPTLAAFFDDLPERLAAAHLVITRSGASSVAELLALGRPALLVPYRQAADDHQRANAEVLAAAGAAMVVLEDDLDAATLADVLTQAAATPARLAVMAERARGLARAGAAAALADALMPLISRAAAPADKEALA